MDMIQRGGTTTHLVLNTNDVTRLNTSICHPALPVAVQRSILQKFITFTKILHLYPLNHSGMNENTKKTHSCFCAHQKIVETRKSDVLQLMMCRF
jgi:hypothetical protein